MSHLSRISTSINDEFILKQTLQELGFDCQNKMYKTEKNNSYHTEYHNIIVKTNNKDLFEFIWDGKEYSFIADFQLWHYNIPHEQLIEKIIQKYSYNTILKESVKQGFNHVSNEILQDGSIKLLIQRWN